MAEKNKYGQYFTIKDIADFMVGLITKDKNAKVLEPSCGKGVFLDSLSDNKFIHLSAYEIDKTLITNHKFVKYESFISSPVNETFDVVIGNPPYIRWKNLEVKLKEELQGSKLWNTYFNSLCDYLFIFILKSIEQLRDEGELIFICTDYWMNTTHSQSLRDYMCDNGYFEEIYQFKEAPLFEKVTASFVIFRYRKSKEAVRSSIKLFKYNKRGVPTPSELRDLSCFDKSYIPQFTSGSRWILAPEDIQSELRKFEKACLSRNRLFSGKLNRIGDYCDIGNGMVSGLDSIFKVADVTSLNKKERQSLIKVLKAKDLETYKYTSESTYIFINKKLTVDEFADQYPTFNRQLLSCKEQLEKRYSYGREIPMWEFVFPRNQKLFEKNGKKIFVPCKERISKKKYFRFCLAPEGYYPLQDVTGILKKDNCKESIEYLLAYLNTKTVFDWLCFNGVVKGEIVEFSEAPIASIPYRTINWDNPVEVGIHEQITKEIQLYLADNSDTHIKSINNLFTSLFMATINYASVIASIKGQSVERPNKATSGTLSGHAAGEPFEKCVYKKLKDLYPNNIFKQYEYLNDVYLKNPQTITVEERYALLDSPTALFLLSRGDKATKEWSPENIFEEKQNDTADILFHNNGYYDMIDVKTRNVGKSAQAPNIISAYKLARTCANMIDNEEYDTININYIEVDWVVDGNNLKCTNVHHGCLFKANPETLYINWAAGMQIQFHVCDLDQSWGGSMEDWAKAYIRIFVESAKRRCKKMEDDYIAPFLKYIKD